MDREKLVEELARAIGRAHMAGMKIVAPPTDIDGHIDRHWPAWASIAEAILYRLDQLGMVVVEKPVPVISVQGLERDYILDVLIGRFREILDRPSPSGWGRGVSV